MSNLGGTHKHTILEDFLSKHNTLKTALNNNLKRFAPDYLRNHLNNKAEYLLFKHVRKTLTFWYTKCQSLYKYLLTLGPIAGHPTTSLLNATHQALHCIEFTETLLNTTNNSFLIAKAFRTVVLTYKNLSDGHLRREAQSQNTTNSTPWSTSYLLNKRISSSNYNTYCSDTRVSSGTDSKSSRTVETQTENTEQLVNTDDIQSTKDIHCRVAEVQTVKQNAKEVGTNTDKPKEVRAQYRKDFTDSPSKWFFQFSVSNINEEGQLLKILPNSG